MTDISSYNGSDLEPLNEYHDRIKADIAEIMLKRMVGDVRTLKERAEFMNACVGAAATLAAGQAVVLASAAKDPAQRQAIIDTGRENAVHELMDAYNTYVERTLKEPEVEAV